MGRRFALLIGCDTYRNPGFEPLVTPVTDIRALADLLRNPEVGRYDQVILIPDNGQDATKRSVERALDRFFLGCEPDDLLFVYIACHGTRPKDELYFAMADTARHLLGSTAIAGRWLADRIKESPAGQVILLLDCCYSGAYNSRATSNDPYARAARDLEATRETLVRLEGEGRFVITASRATGLAYEQRESTDGRLPRSVFIDAVITGIETGAADRDNDGRISAFELYEYIHDYLSDQGSSQVPMYDGRGAGQIYVAWRQSTTPPPAPRQDPAEAGTSGPISGPGPLASGPLASGPLVPGALAPVPRPREPARVRVVDIPLPPLNIEPQEYLVRLWLRQVGDHVQQGETLVELLHHDTVYRVEAPATGILRAVTATETERIDHTAVIGAVVIGGTARVPAQRGRPRSAGNAIRTVLVSLSTLDRGVAGRVTAWWGRVGEHVTAGSLIGQAVAEGTVINIIAPATGIIRAIVVNEQETVLRPDTVAILALP